MATRSLTGFSIRIPKEDIAATQALLKHINDGSAKVLTRSLNATCAKVRNKSITTTRKYGIRSEVRLSKDYVSSRVKGPKEKAANRATFQRQEAKITTPYRGASLARYATSSVPDGRPIKVKVKPRGGEKIVRSPYGGKEQPFFLLLRKGNWKGDKYGLFFRNPKTGKLDHRYGDSWSQVMRRKMPALSEFGQQDLEERIPKETERELKRFERGF